MVILDRISNTRKQYKRRQKNGFKLFHVTIWKLYLNFMKMILTHIAKSWKIFPKIGWSLRGFLGKFFQTFFKISDFGSWVRSISGKFFQPNFLSTYSGKKFVFWFRVMSEEHFWKIFPASFHECLLRKKVCFRHLGWLERVSDHFWVIK